MRILVGFMGAWAVAVTALVMPPRAAACSCVGDPIYRSDPSDGESDVALNRAIFIEGVFVSSSIRLEDESGSPVEFDLNAGPWPGCQGTSADVIPKAPLAPNTRYTVRVDPLFPEALDPSDSSSLTFTTGTKMLPDTSLEPPSSGKASVVFDGPEPFCGGGTVYTCLGIDEVQEIELIMRREREVLMRTTTVVQNDGLYALPSVPDCVELRRRAPTGKRSAPLTICGDALNARPWVASDTAQQVVQCRDGVIGVPPSARDAGAPDAGSGAQDAGSQSEDDARAEEPGSDSDRHEKRGCAAASDGDPSDAGAFALLLLASSARRRLRATI